MQETVESPCNQYELKKKEKALDSIESPEILEEDDEDLEDDSSDGDSDDENDLEEIDEEDATEDDMAEIDPSNIIKSCRTRGIRVDYVKDVNCDDILEDDEDDTDFNVPS
ncbi:hypothetical protein T552_01973 [Pneumocystis carinii B80]|uniref:Histone chaperone domain-containing protein n=1 Tax=Pneumocystis carinii (strain B80) TaxID=1408658 RepID=A0A0W4ZIA9_PNEC8|nr:hypothetical protein T552_01973 [Pneumocystis carinii B80]KTW28112.1 hypothetical protein T552_01973 [Pneumocystis carinii B80]